MADELTPERTIRLLRAKAGELEAIEDAHVHVHQGDE